MNLSIQYVIFLFKCICLIQLNTSFAEEPPCGGNITEPTIIETPGFPNRTEPEMSCSWIITVSYTKYNGIHCLD